MAALGDLQHEVHSLLQAAEREDLLKVCTIVDIEAGDKSAPAILHQIRKFLYSAAVEDAEDQGMSTLKEVVQALKTDPTPESAQTPPQQPTIKKRRSLRKGDYAAVPARDDSSTDEDDDIFLQTPPTPVDPPSPTPVELPSPTPEPDAEPQPELQLETEPEHPVSSPQEPEARYPTRNRQPTSMFTYDQLGTPTQQVVAPVMASPVDPRYVPVPQASYSFQPTLPMYPGFHAGHYPPAPPQYYPQHYGQGWLQMTSSPVSFNPIIAQ